MPGWLNRIWLSWSCLQGDFEVVLRDSWSRHFLQPLPGGHRSSHFLDLWLVKKGNVTSSRWGGWAQQRQHICYSRNEKLIIKDCTELGHTRKKIRKYPAPLSKTNFRLPFKAPFELLYAVARLKPELLTTRSCFLLDHNKQTRGYRVVSGQKFCRLILQNPSILNLFHFNFIFGNLQQS